MEGKILEEVSYFSDTIRSQNGKAFNIHVSQMLSFIFLFCL